MVAVFAMIAGCASEPATPPPEPTAAVSTCEARVRDLVAAWFSSDEAAVRATYHPETPERVDDLTRARAEISAAVPDAKLVFDDAIADGDAVALRLSIAGTHGGPFLGVPASGKAVTVRMTWWARCDDRGVRDVEMTGDLLAVFAEIGQFPSLGH